MPSDSDSTYSYKSDKINTRDRLVLKESESRNFIKFSTSDEQPSPWFDLSRLILGVERQYICLKKLMHKVETYDEDLESEGVDLTMLQKTVEKKKAK